MIAQLCFSDAKGGLELSALKLALDFKKDGSASAMICRGQTFLSEKARQQGLKVLEVSPRSKYFDFKTSQSIRRFIIENDVQALYVHSLRDLWILYPALVGLSSITVIGMAHMFIRDIKKKDPLHRLIYSKLKCLVTMTEVQKNELLKCLPLRPEQYILIPNGVDTGEFQPGPKPKEILESWGCSDSDILIGFVGRFDPQKGVFELLEAARELARENSDLKFIFMGHDTLPESPTEKRMHEVRKTSALENSVIIESFKPDVSRYMRSFDIFIMPSYEESFGLVLIEAMASGVACISTAAGGPLEILEGGRVGLLAQPKSSASLTEQLRKLISQPELRKQLAEAGRKKAVETYDSRIVFQRLKDLIRS